MDILVRGGNVEVEPEVEAETRRKLERLGRLASDIRRIEVDFLEVRNPREPNSHECEIVAHLTGHLVKAHGAAPEQRTALDRAYAKAEQQVSKLHSKRVARSKPKNTPGATVA
jgi:ribosomal subunit interface protein